MLGSSVFGTTATIMTICIQLPNLGLPDRYAGVGGGAATSLGDVETWPERSMRPFYDKWTLDCADAVDMRIIIAGKEYLIHPGDIAWLGMGSTGGRCYGGLQENNNVSREAFCGFMIDMD